MYNVPFGLGLDGAFFFGAFFLDDEPYSSSAYDASSSSSSSGSSGSSGSSS